MKLGILGTGSIVRELLPQLGELGLEKTYLFATPRSKEKAEGLVAQYHLTGVVCDYDEFLALDMDTVYVALPNHLHYEYTKKALLHGKHVILEKPATPRRSELEELFTLAEERGLFLIEAVPMLQREGYHILHDAIRKIGKPKMATLYYCQRSSRYDAFLRGELHPVFDPKLAGGALMDLGVYNLQALVGLFGAPQRVDYHANVTGGIDISGVVNLDYGQFQAAAFAAKDCASPDQSVFMGEEGQLLVNLRRLDGYTLIPRAGEVEEVHVEASRDRRLLIEFQAFKKMIEEKDYPAMNRLKEISLTVSGIVEQARKKAGILFPGD